MRSGLSTLVFHLTNHKLHLSLLSSNFVTATIRPSLNNTNAIFDRFHPFRTNPSRHFGTVAGKSPRIFSRMAKRIEMANLLTLFHAAGTKEEMLKIYADMELLFKERQLAAASVRVALKLEMEGDDPEKILSLAAKAYKALSISGKPSLLFFDCVRLMGFAYCNLGRFNDSLEYLNKAHKLLGSFEEHDHGHEDALLDLINLENKLASVKLAMGKREEAFVILRKLLKLKESIFGENSKELAPSHLDLAKAYVTIFNFKEALPSCLKSLEINSHLFGNNSVEVGRDRQLLGFIYGGLGDFEMALEQTELSKVSFKSSSEKSKDDSESKEIDLELSLQLFISEYLTSDLQSFSGKDEEAFISLKDLAMKTGEDSYPRAIILMDLAKTLKLKQSLYNSKKCLDIAFVILRKNETLHPFDVSQAYMNLASQYELIGQLKHATSALKRALNMWKKIPQELQSEARASVRIAALLAKRGKNCECLKYLESSVELIKECFGPKHFEVGFLYQNMGTSYLELQKPEKSVLFYYQAKDIMDSCFGPHHSNSIHSLEFISKAFAVMGMYSRAIEFQQQAIDGWESHGVNGQVQCEKSKRILELLEKNAMPPPIQAMWLDGGNGEVL